MSKQGFTLIELSLSLVFIGVLSITAVLIINNTVLAYRRGLTLKEVNDTGMELVRNMRAAIQGSSYAIYDDEGRSNWTTSFRHESDVEINGVTQSVPLYGGFCTGKYSYIWKSGYLSNDNNTVKINGNKEFRLVRIKDSKDKPNKTACDQYAASDGAQAEFSSDDEYDELLPEGSNLAIYDLYVPTPAVGGAAMTAYYTVSFILGTIGGGINIMAQGDYCAPPEGSNSNFNYCAINKFNFAAQAGGLYGK